MTRYIALGLQRNLFNDWSAVIFLEQENSDSFASLKLALLLVGAILQFVLCCACAPASLHFPTEINPLEMIRIII